MTTFQQVPLQQDPSGSVWIPLKQAAQSLDFAYDWNPSDGTFKMGFTDVMYQVEMNQHDALSYGQTVFLPAAPKLIGQEPYINAEALKLLWNIPVSWQPEKNAVTITPLGDGAESGTGGVHLQSLSGANVLGLKDINETKLIQYARRFMGVPYRFGASPYPRSHRFDCSSYTQYVFSKFGVKLPRTARAQARQGYRVNPTRLKKGDLLFFSVPGRFKTNRVIGHVGIYLGNGKFINTYGKPGVTISSTRSSYWRKNFIVAKRVVE